jgi:hypothetical protein
MPYIITTYGCRSVYGTPNVVVVKDRRAVATLDEAREAARRIARELPPVLSPSPAAGWDRDRGCAGSVGAAVQRDASRNDAAERRRD